MPFFTDNIRAGASGATASFQIERSLRLDGSDGYLTRTPSSTGNRKIWTWSGWIKRSKLFNNDYIFSCNSQSGNDGIAALYWKSGNNRLQFYFDTDGSNPYGDINEREYRDVGSWYHIVWQVDASNTTHRIWVNGVEENITGGQPPNYSYAMNRSGYVQAMGSQGWDSHTNRGHMYFAECYYSDGYKYAASDFGEINSDTGVWSPKEEVNITYGTNGFHLKFDDNSSNTAATIGKDSSGNGNNWTPNGIAVGDAVKDSPTNNFCTFNQLTNYDELTLAEGGLKATATSTWDMVRSTMGVSSGKWYFEVRCNAAPDNEGWIAGIHEAFGRDNDGYWIYNGNYTAANYGYAYGVQDNNQRRKNATGDDAFDTGDIQPGDVVGIRLDLDNNEILISVNGSDKGKMYDIQGGITYTPMVDLYQGASATLNCGQDSTFHGGETAGGNTDANGIGDFKYAVPSGYKAICSANLPDPAILLPNKYFETRLYSGSQSGQSGFEFAPNWVWVRGRDFEVFHNLFYTARGASKRLNSNRSAEESTNSTLLNGFTSDGYTFGSNTDVQGSGRNYVNWVWKEDTTAGFDIVLHNVNSTGSDFTISHGLGVTPAAIFAKNRDADHSWRVFHQKIGVSQTEFLDSYGTPSGNANRVRAVSSSNFTFRTNTSGNFVFYVFSEVEAFSKFGKYYGNNANLGTFVYLGFRPNLLMVKRTDSDRDWIMYDSARSTFNKIDDFIKANGQGAEETANANSVDFVSNGFKFRNNSGDMNGAGEYVYFAWAESPFKNARAR